MDIQECIKFASENPVCFLATSEGDQPRVRALLMWFANENGFYFATMSPKQVFKQLKSNPKVEICFYNNAADLKDAKMMRITGLVDFLEDEELKNKILQDRAYLADLAGRPLDDITEVFRINRGEAYFWTMADILKEPELERIKF
jgi:pyridoxamine 5'-phosphate oxidase